MSDLVPARAVHPGRIIARELEARGWTKEHLAKLADLPVQTVSKVIAGDLDVTADLAGALEAGFKVPSSFWLSLQENYETDKAGIEARNADKRLKAKRKLARAAHAPATAKKRPRRSPVPMPRTVARRGTRKPKA